jgi:biotin carboxylase
MQKPAILAARELGFFVIALDANPRAEAVPLADRFVGIDIKDAEAVRDFALAARRGSSLPDLPAGELGAVFTAGTDFSASVSLACEACGLPGHSFEAALNASDKVRMRRCFQAARAPSPKFLELDFSGKGPVPQGLPPGFQLPLVVKPVDNMGARGCRMVRTPEELEGALADAAANSRTGRVILEEYMEGPEFSIDALVHQGTLTICGFADRHIFFPPYFVEMGHTMPSRLSPEGALPLIHAFAKGVFSLGLTCGAAKGDVKLTPRGPMIGEIAARLSGGYMSGWTYPLASGLNLTKEALRIAAGQPPADMEHRRVPLPSAPGVPLRLYDVPCTAVSAERAWISVPGVITETLGLDEARRIPGVTGLFLRASGGDGVVFPRNNVQKCGNVIALGKDHAQAIDAAERAVGAVVLRLEPGNPDTGAFLRGKDGAPEQGFPPPAFAVPPEVLGALPEETALIPAGAPAAESLPASLAPFLDSPRDWNCRTLRQTLARFDSLRPDHPPLGARAFWLACIRGGIQGALALADEG